MTNAATPPAHTAADDYALARLRASASPLYLREAEVQRGVALLLLGQGHLLSGADALLRASGIGRAHWRVLAHVARWPGITPGDLTALTGTSKQAQTRVMRDLAARNLVRVLPGVRDRRQRLLHPTEAGTALAAGIEAALGAAMGEAYAGAGQAAVTGFWQVLEGLIPVAARLHITALAKARQTGRSAG